MCSAVHREISVLRMGWSRPESGSGSCSTTRLQFVVLWMIRVQKRTLGLGERRPTPATARRRTRLSYSFVRLKFFQGFLQQEPAFSLCYVMFRPHSKYFLYIFTAHDIELTYDFSAPLAHLIWTMVAKCHVLWIAALMPPPKRVSL